MILGFSQQFIPYVLDGSKRHTIRAGQRWAAGARGDMYAESRRPKKYDAAGLQIAGMSLLFRATITKVEKFRLWYPRVTAAGECLGAFMMEIEGVSVVGEANEFFHRDGFRKPGITPVSQALQFWHKRLLAGPFEGQIVHWDYDGRSIWTSSDTARAEAKRLSREARAEAQGGRP